ncbi:MAG: START domain-containing protein [Lentimicrobiaceae bacterium]|jgi:hypothetical protein
MKHYHRLIIIVTFSLFIAANDLYGQSWDFIKEVEGIKIYTRKEVNSSLKSFKGEIMFKANTDKVYLIVGNAKNLDWWDKSIIEIKVLDFVQNKSARYYLVYDVPWPLSRRDLVLEAQISTDPVTGDRTVFSKPLFNVIPEKPGLVRIKKYWQKWTIQTMENGYVHVILEGFVDPGGNIPSWLYNTVITETPLKVMKALRDRVLSSKPAVQ